MTVWQPTLTIQMTGDREPVAATVVHDTGIELFWADLNPNAKMSKIQELKSKGQVIAMV